MKSINILIENGKTREELLDVVEVRKTTVNDSFDIIKILTKCMNLKSFNEGIEQLLYSNVDIDNSVKLVDKNTDEIYGILLFNNFPISNGTPIMRTNNELGKYLMGFKHINGFLFFIDKRLRNSGLDKKMLSYNMEYLNKFDFIWCGVDKSLRSDKYWERINFIKVSETDDANFYVMARDKKLSFYIFIVKLMTENYEKDNYF